LRVSIFNSLLLRLLPVRDPGSLVLLTQGSWTYPIWEAIRRYDGQLFDGVFAWSEQRFDLSPGGTPQLVDGAPPRLNRAGDIRECDPGSSWEDCSRRRERRHRDAELRGGALWTDHAFIRLRCRPRSVQHPVGRDSCPPGPSATHAALRAVPLSIGACRRSPGRRRSRVIPARRPPTRAERHRSPGARAPRPALRRV
jgi:hypothetical protein